MQDSGLSTNERQFIEQAARQGIRADGRACEEARPVEWSTSLQGGWCRVALGGDTSALARVSAALTPPGERGSEGSLRLRASFAASCRGVGSDADGWALGGAFAAHAASAGPAEGGAGATGGRAGGPSAAALPGSGAFAGASGPPSAAGLGCGRRAEEQNGALTRFLERALRESRALDLEALAAVPGRFAWALELDVQILQDGGSAWDAALLSALGALASFKRPAVSLALAGRRGGAGEKGERGRGADAGLAASIERLAPVTLHEESSKPSLPLTLHHVPLPSSFAVVGGTLVLDPSAAEQEVGGGVWTVVVAPGGEICLISKTAGAPLLAGVLRQSVHLAAQRAQGLGEAFRAEMERHAAERAAAAAATSGRPRVELDVEQEPLAEAGTDEEGRERLERAVVEAERVLAEARGVEAEAMAE